MNIVSLNSAGHILLLSALFSAAVGIYTLSRRSARGAAPIGLLMLAVAAWSLGYAFEISSRDLATALFWGNLQYVGIAPLPLLWLVFAAEYTERGRYLTRRRLAFLSLIPLLTFIFAWTNDAHGLMRRSASLNADGALAALTLTRGIWFAVHVAYSYTLLLIGTLLIVQAFLRAPRLYRAQTAVVLIGALVPWIGNVLYVTGWNPLDLLDLTPFAFTITGIVIGVGLFRFHLLDIAPIAREVVIESMGDAMLVLDAQNRVVDANPAMLALFPRADVIGQPAAQVLSAWAHWVERYIDARETREEIAVGEGEERRWFDMRISPLRDRQSRFAGRVVTLRDITAPKQTEEHLRASDAELRALFAAIDDVILVLDAEGRYLKVAPTNPTLLYKPAAQVWDKTLHEIFPPEQVNAFLGHIRRALATRQTINVEYSLEIEGRVVWFAGVVSPMTADSVVWIARDITKRKRAEEELKESARRIALLNDITRAAIEAVDLRAMLQILADRLGELFDADGAYITLWDEEHQRTIPAAAYGHLRETYPATPPHPGELTMTESVLRAGHTLVAEDALNSPYVSPRIVAQYPARSVLGLPLMANGQKLGAAIIGFNQPHHFTPDEVARGEQVAAQISLAIAKARALETAQFLAITDPLTGIHNRRYLFELGEREVIRARRFQHPLCAIMADIDHFKVVNDQHGHAVGDEVLRGIAARLSEQVREIDLLAKYGGEEFAVVLPETDLHAASDVAERLRQAIAAEPFPTKVGALAVTLSFGVARAVEHTKSLTELLDTADRAMYRAKEAGRNCVRCEE